MDNVRVAKLLGGGLHNSCIVRGMVLKSDAVGSIKRMEKAKVRSLCLCLLWTFLAYLVEFILLRIIALCLCLPVSCLQVAVFAGGVDTTATETKGTVLIHSAEQVSFFTRHFQCDRLKS